MVRCWCAVLGIIPCCARSVLHSSKFLTVFELVFCFRFGFVSPCECFSRGGALPHEVVVGFRSWRLFSCSVSKLDVSVSTRAGCVLLLF